MGDEDHCACTQVLTTAQQELFQPLESFDVEMVGRLIEIENVGSSTSRRQCACDGESFLPTTRKTLGHLIHACVVETNFAQHDCGENFGLMNIAMNTRATHRRRGARGARSDARTEVIALRNIDRDGSTWRANESVIGLFTRGQHA